MSRTWHARPARRHRTSSPAHRYRNHDRWFAKHVMWSPHRAPGVLDREVEDGLREYQDHTTVWGDPDYTSFRAGGMMQWDAKLRVDGARYSAEERDAIKKLRRLIKRAQRGDLSAWRFKALVGVGATMYVSASIDWSKVI